MESHLWFSSEDKNLKLGFKEYFFSGKQGLKLKGNVNTVTGHIEGRANLFTSVNLRNFPGDKDVTRIRPGIVYDFGEEDAKMRVAAKKMFVLDDGKLWRDTNKTHLKLKGWADVSLLKNPNDYKGLVRAEVIHLWYDFNKTQDLKIKAGARVDNLSKGKSLGDLKNNVVGYLKIRENNWHFQVDTDKKWFVRYDL